MKRQLSSMLLIAIIACLLLHAYCAEADGPIGKGFDHTVFKDHEYYNEDKFDKTWQVVEVPAIDDKKCFYALYIEGDMEGNVTEISIAFIASKNNAALFDVTSGQLLVDDGRVFNFEFSDMYKQYNIEEEHFPDFLFTKEEAKEFLDALTKTGGISLRINSDSGRFDEEFSNEELKAVKELADELIKQDGLEYYDDSVARGLVDLKAYSYSIS